MSSHHWIIGLVPLLIFALIEDTYALKNVILSIEPKVVERKHGATLRCSYDLEDDVLYSVKWYRGRHEFYRYTQSENPSTKVFPFGGITVDVNNSNSTQVVLTDIEFNLSGNFSCEVTTDVPFSTGTDTQSMLVVQLPDNPPTISVGRDPLDYGDMLRANCSSPPARPPALLKFLLNNLTVARSEPLTPRKTMEQAWSDLTLEMELYEFHFSQGRLILKCVSEVADIYHEEAELELDSARDPIPQRVSAVGSANYDTSHRILLVLLFVYILFFCS